MQKPKVTVSLTKVLDNDFWGIEEMLEGGLLSINNIRELIKEDILTLVEDVEPNICIEMVEVRDE